MLLDELREKIKAVEPDMQVIRTFWEQSGLEQDYRRLHDQTNEELFWQNPQQALILKELQKRKVQYESYTSLIEKHAQLPELLALFEDDEQELLTLKDDIYQWAKGVSRFKIALLLQDEVDSHNCFFSINSGAGGTESQDWAELLLRMYLRFCEREQFSVAMYDYQQGEAAGIKSATLYIKGKNSYGLLRGEAGVHRLVRISPFDASKRRHTSFAAVTVIPEMPSAQIVIDPKDLRVDTYRAGGAGGQHVNKTDSAVRITHIPTNIVVQCQNERSQLQNKESAMKMLMAKLVQKEEEENKSRDASVEKKKIEWGSQIRSYILHPYKLVKDHRTDVESQQPEIVLDGDIMPFIEANLIRVHTE